MPRFSAFTPCGVLRLSAKPSPGKLYYETLKKLYGGMQPAGQPPFDLTVGTHLEASLYARARGLARSQMLLARAGDQGKPDKAYELIPNLEIDYHLSPGPNDTYTTRQKALTAASIVLAGNTYANIVSGLQGILGANFLDYVVAPLGAVVAAAPVVGASSGKGHYADVRIPTKFLQLVDPVVTTGGTSYCAYKNLDTTASPVALVPGDWVVVQGENTSQIEVVQVAGAWFSPPAAANGTATAMSAPSGTPTWSKLKVFAKGQLVAPATPNGFWFQCIVAGTTGATEPAWSSQFGVQVTDGTVTWNAVGAATVFSAVFQKSHDIGASCLVGNFPFQWSTQRFSAVIVNTSVASDRETRRKVDEFMRRTVRGVSSWAIVGATPGAGGHIYQTATFSAGVGMGTTPISQITK